MSKLPIKGNQTLVYGYEHHNNFLACRSRDAGATILCDPFFNESLKPICKELGLKPHKVRAIAGGSALGGSSDNIPALFANQEEYMMYTPVDLEGHRGKDGRNYLVDFR